MQQSSSICGGTCVVSPESHPYPFESHVTNGPSGTVYRDDFSDRNSGWPQHPDSHYVSGGYELSTVERTTADITAAADDTEASCRAAQANDDSGPTYRDNVVAAYGPSWRDFHVSATMKGEFEGPRPSAVHACNSRIPFGQRRPRLSMNQKGYYALLVSPSVRNEKKLAFEVVARTFKAIPSRNR